MIPEHEYPRHAPPPSCRKRAEFVGTLADVDVWWDQVDREYWYNLPGGPNAWTSRIRAPRQSELAAAFPLSEAHRLLNNL